MNTPSILTGILALILPAPSMVRAAFTPLVPLPAPKVISSSEAYPGDSYRVTNLFDGNIKTEHSSNAKGTNTFVELEFPRPVRLGAIRHVDRNDPATVGASELLVLDQNGKVVKTVSVPHVNQRGGETFFILPEPVEAQKVRWRVTRLGATHSTVGGAELSFLSAEAPEPAPSRDRLEVRAIPFLEKNPSGNLQPVKVTIQHLYAEPVAAQVTLQGAAPQTIQLKPGANTLEFKLPEAKKTAQTSVALEIAGKSVAESKFERKPVRALSVYILPHSHTDIGYTEIQTAIEQRQVQNLIDGMAHARRTASYPEGSRFIWNVEVLWAADLYLRRLNDQQRADFLAAVKNGQVCLNGMYLNELTGVCRPEELLRLFRFSTELAEKTGVPIESVMISDVPGYTWGTVSAMAHAGIRYFSTAPNYFDRIGTILREWENKPFWWLGPDGKTKVLVWIPFWGYAMSHVYHKMTPKLVEDFYDGLEKRGYPYDVAHVRWSGHGDNAIPDPAICDFVKEWNAKYASPRFIISGTTEAFRALEQRYGKQLPVARGDWTPYWEDGVGSSALQTAMNRHSSDRVAQAETLFAMLNPRGYNPADFTDTWNNVLLYSEHTWGAWCSVNQPERKETHEQWEIKRGYAEKADAQSRVLFARALTSDTANSSGADAEALEVLNTTSWPRSDLVLLPDELSKAGDRVVEEGGAPVPSQRLRSGELAFLPRAIPPFSAKRFRVTAGDPHTDSKASVQGNLLDSGVVRMRVDESSGGIVELTAIDIEGNFVDTSDGASLNDYLYLIGDDLKDVRRAGRATIRVGEPGPLVASLIVESDAPGCKKLTREFRVVAGADYVIVDNLVDKERLKAASYMAKEGKESLNFGYAFNVPDGEIVLDVPLGLMRPEKDQLASACKNWFTVGRWADVSNRKRGITWVTLDAPLVQVGGLTARLLNSQTNPDVWRKRVEPTQKLYSWAMNNHWGTNYRAYQDGPTRFRFILRPHAKRDHAEASRFATAFSQPLLPRRAGASKLPAKPLLQVQPDAVLVSGLKPSDDGKAWIIRLFGASGENETAKLQWGDRQPKAVFLSDTSERPSEKIRNSVKVPGAGIVTLRVELE